MGKHKRRTLQARVDYLERQLARVRLAVDHNPNACYGIDGTLWVPVSDVRRVINASNVP